MSEFRKIVLSEWVPALITAVIGGVVVAYLAPMLQAEYAESAALQNRRVELWESLGENFTNAINANDQLVSVSQEIAKLTSTGEEVDGALNGRLEYYRIERDKYASAFNKDLVLSAFYFGDEVDALAREYGAWINEHGSATVEEMPSRGDFMAWRDRFLVEIGEFLDDPEE